MLPTLLCIISMFIFRGHADLDVNNNNNNGTLTVTAQPPFIEYHNGTNHTMVMVTFSFWPPCNINSSNVTIYRGDMAFFSTSRFNGQLIRVGNLTHKANGRYYALCGANNYFYAHDPLRIGVLPRILSVDVKRGTSRLSEYFYNLTRRSYSNFQDSFALPINNVSSRIVDFAHFSYVTMMIRVLEGVNPSDNGGNGFAVFQVPQFEKGGIYSFIRGPDVTTEKMDNMPVKVYSFVVRKNDLIASGLCHIEGTAIAGYNDSAIQDRTTFNFEVAYDAAVSTIIVDRGATTECNCLFTCKAAGCPSDQIVSYEWALYNLAHDFDDYGSSDEDFSYYDYDGSTTRKRPLSPGLNYLAGNVADRPDQYQLNASECQEMYENVMNKNQFKSYRISCRIITTPSTFRRQRKGMVAKHAASHANLYELLRPCTVDEFQCTRSRQCIPVGKVCDDQIDCVDGSDEDLQARNCLPLTLFDANASSQCPYGHFRCSSSGDCILMSKKCDFKVDCQGGEDEANCQHAQCKPGQFQCRNGQCIDLDGVCDGKAQCVDQSDESDQLCKFCASQLPHDDDVIMWQCHLSKKCIHISRLCNQNPDCGLGDMSDESSEACRFVFRRRLENGVACPPGTVQCSSNPLCVGIERLCDGVPDCCYGNHDNNCEATDENGCQVGTCSTRYQTCKQECVTVNITKPQTVCGGGNDGSVPGYYCACKSGFNRLTNGDCADIDECQSPLANNCTQICENYLGTYECQCNDGFNKVPIFPQSSTSQQHPAAFTCQPSDDSSNIDLQLLFIYGNSIWLIDGRRKTHKIIAYTSLGKRFQAMDVDIRDGTVIYVEKESNRLQRTALPIVSHDGDESEEQPPSLAMAQPTNGFLYSEIIDISIDFIGNNLYVADRSQLLGLSRISVSLIDGRFAKILRENRSAEITCIAVNPLISRLYFATFSQNKRTVSIVMTSMDGQSSSLDKEIWNLDDFNVRIRSIVVDYLGSGRLYFTVGSASLDAAENSVYIANYDGSGFQRFHVGTRLKAATSKAFDIFGDSLFGIFSSTAHDGAYFVLEMDKFGRIGETHGSNLTGPILANGGELGLLKHLKIYHPLKAGFIDKTKSPCLELKCSHLCLRSIDKRATCACPEGVNFDNSNSTNCRVNLSPISAKKGSTSRNSSKLPPQHPYDCLMNCVRGRGRCVATIVAPGEGEFGQHREDNVEYKCKCFDNYFGSNCNLTTAEDSVDFFTPNRSNSNQSSTLFAIATPSSAVVDNSNDYFSAKNVSEATEISHRRHDDYYLGFFVAIVVLVGLIALFIIIFIAVALLRRMTSSGNKIGNTITTLRRAISIPHIIFTAINGNVDGSNSNGISRSRWQPISSAALTRNIVMRPLYFFNNNQPGPSAQSYNLEEVTDSNSGNDAISMQQVHSTDSTIIHG